MSPTQEHMFSIIFAALPSIQWINLRSIHRRNQKGLNNTCDKWERMREIKEKLWKRVLKKLWKRVLKMVFPFGDLMNARTSCYLCLDSDNAEESVMVTSLLMFCADWLKNHCFIIIWPFHPSIITPTDKMRKVSGLKVIHRLQVR